MTETSEPKISKGFALSAEVELLDDLNLSAALDDDILSVGGIVAAMLSEKHNLSVEELAAFEELLDAPDVDSVTRHELLQTLWNIAMCLIDYQWDNAGRMSSQKNCGPISYECNDAASGSADMINSSNHELTQDHDKAATEALGQKGSP